MARGTLRNNPTISVVGAGNLASSLAPLLKRAGYKIDAVIGRPAAASQRRARFLASEVGAHVRSIEDAMAADLVWLCVSDGAIGEVARVLAERKDWTGKIVFHSSGALTSDELAPLRKRGAKVASVHPMMTFVKGSQLTLAGVPFAIEGDQRAVRVARQIVREVGGKPFAIARKNKVAYHAWGMFASPLLVALLATTEHVAAEVGVTRKEAKQRMMPIIRQTIANYEATGAAESFSGPIVRGDVNVVKQHLRVLRRIPVVREVYVALAKAATAYLPAKQRSAMKKLLSRFR